MIKFKFTGEKNSFIPYLLTNIVRNSYEGITCRVGHGLQLTDAFEAHIWSSQGKKKKKPITKHVTQRPGGRDKEE